MGKARVVSAIAGVAMTAAIVGASTASAATLIGDYQLQGTRASSGPGNVLVDVGGSNSFISDSVLTASSRQVLAFPLHGGVKLAPAGIGGSTAPYSVVTTFKLAAVSGYRRILDPSPGVYPANGIYELDGQISIYGDSEARSPQVLLSPNTYATVAITSAPPTQTAVYVNGNPAVQAPETIDVTADTLRFFKDEDTDTEDSAGAVSCIRVFQGVLSDTEVKAIGASATCQAPPQPTTTTTKPRCKKHKKKHRAAEAKKKKCKKHKKR